MSKLPFRRTVQPREHSHLIDHLNAQFPHCVPLISLFTLIMHSPASRRLNLDIDKYINPNYSSLTNKSATETYLAIPRLPGQTSQGYRQCRQLGLVIHRGLFRHRVDRGCLQFKFSHTEPRSTSHYRFFRKPPSQNSLLSSQFAKHLH